MCTQSEIAERMAENKLEISILTALKQQRDALLAACKHGAMSSHHPACSHGKRGDGNTCECHVKKCQQAVAKAEK